VGRYAVLTALILIIWSVGVLVIIHDLETPEDRTNTYVALAVVFVLTLLFFYGMVGRGEGGVESVFEEDDVKTITPVSQHLENYFIA